MRKLITLIFCMLFLIIGTAYAETDIRSPMDSVSLQLTSGTTIISSGTTTAFNKTATYSGISWFTLNTNDSVIDLKKYKPNIQKYSVQVFQVDLAKSTVNNVTLTSTTASGATYVLYYSVSNVDSSIAWAGAGVTKIGAVMPITGTSLVVQPFTPEFGRYLKLGVNAGMTQYNNIKGVLEIQ